MAQPPVDDVPVRAVTLPRALFVLALLVGATLALPALSPTPEVEPTDVAASADAAVVSPSDPVALALLQRSASVQSSRSWVGNEVIAVVGANPSTVIAEVEHRALVGSELRVVGGTQPLGMMAFSPDSAAITGSSPLTAPTPAIFAGARWAALLAQSFVITDAGQDEVAGQVCDRLELRRVDGATAARVWISRSSGLELQQQVFDSRGGLLRYSTFTRVSLVDDDDVADVGPDMRAAAATAGSAGRSTPASTDGGRVIDAPELATLPLDGWTVPSEVGGDLSLVDARDFGASVAAPHSTGTLQLTYSDGLSTLTVSEQRGHLASRLPLGWVSEVRASSRIQVRRETPERLAWTAHGTVFSMVADTDDNTIDLALRSLPRPAANQGFAPRMRGGIDRIGSWLDPTG